MLASSTHLFAQAAAENQYAGMSAIDIEMRFAVPAESQKIEEAFDRPQEALSEADQIFFGFEIVELKGRPLHESYFPIQGNPVAGHAFGLAELDGPIKTREFKLLSESHQLLSVIALEIPESSSSDVFHFGSFSVPEEPFKAAVSGQTQSDEPFEIVLDRIYVPQTVSASITPENSLAAPGEFALQLDVINLAADATFQIEVENNLDLPISVSESNVNLNEGSSSQLAIDLDLPNYSSGYLEVTVTATVTSQSDDSITNTAQAQVVMERFDFITTDGFESLSAE